MTEAGATYPSPNNPWRVELDPEGAPNSKGRTPLNLNAGAIQIAQQGIDWGTAALQQFLAVQRYGETPTDWRIQNRVITIPLMLGAYGTPAEEELARRQLAEKVGTIQRYGGTLLRQRYGGEALYADIIEAELTVPDKFGETGGIEPEVTLVLKTRPDLYGEETTLDAVTGQGQIAAVLTEGGKPAVIKGDYPARARLVLTEKSGHNQRGLFWGLRDVVLDPIVNEIKNPSFEAAVTLTVESGASGERSTEQAYKGTHSYRFAKTGSTGTIEAYEGTSSPSSNWEPVTGGEEYTWSVYVRAGSTGRKCHLRVIWATSGLSTDGESVGAEVTDASSGWTRVTLTASAPSTAAWARLDYVISAAEVGEHHYLDARQRNAGGLREYADGSLEGYDWTGAPNESTTQELLSYGTDRKTAKLYYDAYELTPVGGATSSLDAETYSGHAVEVLEPQRELWQPMLETKLSSGEKQLTHLGSYRVWVRAEGDGSGSKLRLAWSNGEATAPITNEAAETPEVWGLVDLGEIRIEEPPVGEHWWTGTIQCYATQQGLLTRYARLDRIWLVPVDDGAGRLRATAVPSSGLTETGKNPTEDESNGTLRSGTAWTLGSPVPEATASLAASSASQALVCKKLGFSLPAGAVVHGIEVTVSGYSATNSSYAQVALLKTGSGLLGTKPLKLMGTGPGQILTFGGSADLWEQSEWSRATVNETAFGVAVLAENVSLGGSCVFHVEQVAVFLYWNYSAAGTLHDAVLYANRKAEARWDKGGYREDESSGSYANISEPTGDLFRLPTSGVEKREVQLLVKNSRGLLPSPLPPGPEADSAIDAIEAQVVYWPCYLQRV